MPKTVCPHGVRKTRCWRHCQSTAAMCRRHCTNMLSCTLCKSPTAARKSWKKCAKCKKEWAACEDCQACLQKTYPVSTLPIVHRDGVEPADVLCDLHFRMVRRACDLCRRAERMKTFLGRTGMALCVEHKDECSKCPKCKFSN